MTDEDVVATPIPADSPLLDGASDVSGEAPPAAEGDPLVQMKTAFNKGMQEVMAKSKPKEEQAKPAPKEKPKTVAKAEAAPAKAAEPEVPAAIKSDKASEHFKKVVADRDNWQKQAEMFKAEMEKAKQMTGPEMEALRSERDKLATELERVALERSPAFQERYNTRFNQAVSAAKRIVGQDRAAAVEALLDQPPSKGRNAALAELADGLAEFDKLQLVGALNSMDAARDERAYELQNHKTTLAKQVEMQKLMERNSQTQTSAYRQQMASEVLKVAGEKFESFKRTDNPEHNAAVAEAEEDVRQFVLGKVPEEKAYLLPVLASEAIFLQKTKIPTLEAKIAELEGELAKFLGNNPKPNDAGDLGEGEVRHGVDGGRVEGPFKSKLEGLLRQVQQR